MLGKRLGHEIGGLLLLVDFARVGNNGNIEQITSVSRNVVVPLTSVRLDAGNLPVEAVVLSGLCESCAGMYDCKVLGIMCTDVPGSGTAHAESH